MKALLLTLPLLVFSLISLAQGDRYIVTTEIEMCYYDSWSEEYTDCDYWDERTIFTFLEDGSGFHHRITDMESDYVIHESWIDQESGDFAYDVTSDAGNDYYFYIDQDYSRIRVVHEDEWGDSFVKYWIIDKTWVGSR